MRPQARVQNPSVEGREFRMRHRFAVPALLVGMLLVFLVAALTLPGPRPSILLPLIGLNALVTLPLVLYVLTSRVSLEGGVLVSRSAFGTTRLVLTEVRRADLRMVSTKGGAREQLRLVGPKTLRVGEQREEWPVLRDAILAGLPPGVRPGT